MDITVLGLGYVGCVSAACLAHHGHRVRGVDVNPLKVDLINAGKSPVAEARVGELMTEAVGRGKLTASMDAGEAVSRSELSLICVGTPSNENGSLDLRYVQNVASDLGRALRSRGSYHVVAVRSTMLPGSTESVVLPMIERESSKKAGDDFGICVNPEFLREGSAVEDYYNPPFTLVGAGDGRAGELLESVYREINAPIIRTDIRTAEMEKYVSNAFHALKVTFANEIGVFCRAVGIDPHEVMNIFTRDHQLNISGKYLNPGFAFGGSCLPKDLRALVHRARALDLQLPLLATILPSNSIHLEYCFRLVQRAGRKKIGILGLSFKSGTDDLRESPMVQMVERLLGKGYDLRIYDRNVSMARIVGANKRYIDHVIPHVSSLLVPDATELLEHAELVIIGNDAPEFRSVVQELREDVPVIDLVRLQAVVPAESPAYQRLPR